jgi:hypothetical protein
MNTNSKLVEVLSKFNPIQVECILGTYHPSLQYQALLLLLEEYVEFLIVNSEYDLAVDVVSKVFTFSFDAAFLKNDYHFKDDASTRDIYKITLNRGSRSFSFDFGQSVSNSSYYEDKKNGNKFTLSGRGINNKYIIRKDYLYSLVAGKKPSLYDVLTRLQKCDVGSFEDFCSEFGYDTDSRQAKKTYKAVCKEYKNMCTLFSNEELRVLSVIQ